MQIIIYHWAKFTNTDKINTTIIDENTNIEDLLGKLLVMSNFAKIIYSVL